MALFSKAQGILKQNLTKEIATPSIIRCMSSSILFVGGIHPKMDDVFLRETFHDFGEVTEARVVMDRDTGRSRGFGFVKYASPEDAAKAIQALDLKRTRGCANRVMRVKYAAYVWDPKGRKGGYGGYGGSGGGSGGGGYGNGGFGGGYFYGGSGGKRK